MSEKIVLDLFRHEPCGCSIIGPLGIGAVLAEDMVWRMIGGHVYAIKYCPAHGKPSESGKGEA